MESKILEFQNWLIENADMRENQAAFIGEMVNKLCRESFAQGRSQGLHDAKNCIIEKFSL